MRIPPKRHPATWKVKWGCPLVARKDAFRQRFRGERGFAWLGVFRRPLIRWERQFGVYLSYCTVAALLLCLRRLERVHPAVSI